MKRRDRPWYLLTGFFLGLIIGLIISLIVAPVEYVDATPSTLDTAGRDFYRSMVALAFTSSMDTGRAEARLVLLNDASPVQALAAQAQIAQAAGSMEEEAGALSALSLALIQQAQSQTIAQSDATLTIQPNGNQTPLATATPQVTFTPRPSATPQPTLGAPFVMLDQGQVCDPTELSGLLQVEVRDAAGRPVPGLRLVASWDGGTDDFYTGLYPEISLGYADLQMTPETTYSLQAGEGGQVVNNLSSPQCALPDGTTYWGGLRITFSQP
jgi:hypothetical protein